jgi:nitrate reductase gamma subunit
MTAVTVLFAFAFYAAAAVLVYGVYAKVRQYWMTPAPLKIPTTPAPVTTRGMVMRMGREVVLFESLFKSSKWTWIFGWLFHAALLLVAIRHLRYVTEPVWQVSAWLQSFGLYAGFAMVVGLGGLLVRRICVNRVRYISAPSDYLMLLLLLGLAGTGLAMKYVAATDIVALKAFMLGLVRFDWHPLPADAVLLAHLSMVVLLMLIFPFSKLLHAPGVFFSPTRNQVDDSRERRHLSAWARQLERR